MAIFCTIYYICSYIIYAVINGYLDAIPVKKVKEYEKNLFEKLEAEYENLLVRFETGYYEQEDIEELKKALASMQR